MVYFAGGVSSGGNTSGTTGTSFGTIVLAGTNGITLSQSTGSNGVFGVTFSGGGSQTVQTQGIQSIAASGGTATSGQVSFANSNNITFGFNAQTITASFSQSVQTQGVLSVAASGGTVTSGQLSFANSNGVTFGINGQTITASVSVAAGGNASYWENLPGLLNTQTITFAQSTSVVFPFFLPYGISASYIRMPLTMSAQSTTMPTTVNTTFSASILRTINLVIYSLGVGASSRSLQSVASGSAGFSEQISLQANSTGSQYSVTNNFTFPFEGANTDSVSFSYAQSSSAYILSSGSHTAFTGIRFLDVPFAQSLASGAYWMGLGLSSTTSTQGGGNSNNTHLVSNRLFSSNLAASQANIVCNLMGAATNSSVAVQLGVGSFTTNAIGTTASLGLSNVSSSASHNMPHFQIIRQA